MQWRWRENDGGCCSYRYLARVAYEALSFPQLPFFPTRSLSPLLIILLSLSSIVGGTTLSLFHTFLLQPNSSLIHTHSLSLCVSVTTLLPHGSRGRLLRQGRGSCTATHRRREASRMQRLRHRRFREAAGALTLSTQSCRLTFAIVKCEYELKCIVVDLTVFQFRILASINVRDLDPKLLTQLNMRYRVRNWNHFCDLIYLPNLDIFDSCLFLPSVILALLRLDS